MSEPDWALPMNRRELIERITALEEERENWLEQAQQGIWAEHQCPAFFACCSIVADAGEPMEDSNG